jgi:PAS domain S-box-containing protein
VGVWAQSQEGNQGTGPTPPGDLRFIVGGFSSKDEGKGLGPLPASRRVSPVGYPSRTSNGISRKQIEQENRLTMLRWTETRDGSRRLITVILPLLVLLGVFFLLKPPSGMGFLGGFLVLAMALVAFLVLVTSLHRTSDPSLAIPASTGNAVALLGLMTAFVVTSGEPATAVGFSLILVATGVFILSVPAIAVVAVAAHVGFIVGVVVHGGATGWWLAGSGLVASLFLAVLAHDRQLHVLRSTLKMSDRENRHNTQLEEAFRKARDAELNAKRLSDSAAEGLRAQREREALRARMQSILDSAGEGIIGTDKDNRVVFVNEAAARLTGYKEGQMVEQDLHVLLHHSKPDGSPYPPNECPVREVFAHRRVKEIDGEVFWRKDGSSFPVAYVASPLVEEGKVQGAVVVFQDVTERAELESMKDELVSVVSHELRTPLTSINGSLQLLRATMPKMPDKAENLVNMATRNTQRLIQLVNELLDLEKLRAGRFEMEPTPVGTMDLAKEAVASLEAYAHEHEASLVTTGEDVTIVADPHRIHQALVNLISNAVKYSPKDGTVRVSLEHDDHNVWFSVSDEGPGIPKAQQKKLFQRFSQLDPSDSRKKGGTGLGLAITRGIIEAHNGQVGILSEPGKGSTFYFMLPRVGAETARVPERVIANKASVR